MSVPSRHTLLPFFLPALVLILSLAQGGVARAKGVATRATSEVCAESHGGNDLLTLVTKKVALRKRFKPRDLVRLPRRYMMPRRKGKLRKEAARHLRKLLAAAKEEGHVIKVRSSYRSFRRQRRVHRKKSRKYGKRRAKSLSAEPGHSQHQLGTTVDLAIRELDYNLSPRLARSPEGKWLAAHAHEFGFVMSYPSGAYRKTGYRYEPWHYRYIGVEAAAEMKSEGLLLDEYLRACQRCGSQRLRCPR